MKYQIPHDAGAELWTDREAAARIRVGLTSFFGLQKRPDFPPPIWLGPRLKRHPPGPLLAWVESQRKRPEGAQ